MFPIKKISSRDTLLYLLAMLVMVFTITGIQRLDEEKAPDYSDIRTYFIQEQVKYFTLEGHTLTLTLKGENEEKVYYQVADPALFLALRGEALSSEEKKARLREMHEAVLEENKVLIGEGRGLACRMADFWHYLIFSFSENAADARPICSARNLAEYRAEVSRLFRERPLREGGFIPKI